MPNGNTPGPGRAWGSVEEYHDYWDSRKREQAEEAQREHEAYAGIPQRRYEDMELSPWAGGLIHGPAGVGKTREALCRLLSKERYPLMFYEATEFIEDSRDIEMDRATETQRRRRDGALHRVSYLVLDDLGARRPTQFAEDMILRLVNERWKNEMETLVTSNLSPSQIADVWGERIASRIFGFGPAVQMNGKDWRLR